MCCCRGCERLGVSAFLGQCPARPQTPTAQTTSAHLSFDAVTPCPVPLTPFPHIVKDNVGPLDLDLV